MKAGRVLSVLLFIANAAAFGQKGRHYNPIEKGHFFAYWGWNRELYTNSDITLKGSDYDIKLSHVRAKDKPTIFSYHNFFQPDRITIPQTNVRFGYFIKSGLAVGFGVDHMKYVMVQDQTVNAKGYIDRPGAYQGSYSGAKKLTADFLTFEHTDGLNYVHLTLDKYHDLYHSKSEDLIVNSYWSGGAGILLPKTNVKFLDYERNDRFHVSGFGLNAAAGLQGVFFRHFIIRLEAKGGYINMPDIILHKKSIVGRGKQYFFFGEAFWALGATYNLHGRKK